MHLLLLDPVMLPSWQNLRVSLLYHLIGSEAGGSEQDSQNWKERQSKKGHIWQVNVDTRNSCDSLQAVRSEAAGFMPQCKDLLWTKLHAGMPRLELSEMLFLPYKAIMEVEIWMRATARGVCVKLFSPPPFLQLNPPSCF